MPSTTRTETDSFGPIQVPADAYWGAQTERSIENFPFGRSEQMLGNRDPRHSRLECDVEMMLARKPSRPLNLAQYPPDDCAQGVLHDFIVGNQTLWGLVVHAFRW